MLCRKRGAMAHVRFGPLADMATFGRKIR